MFGKRAVSDIVAAMLMILIVISGGILIYVYSAGLFGSLQGARPQQPYTAAIALDYYDWTNITTLKLNLRNAGTESVTLVAFYINANSTTPSSSTCPTVTTSPLPPQGSCQVTLTFASQPTRGLAYNVKIVTGNGQVFAYSCIAGSATS